MQMKTVPATRRSRNSTAVINITPLVDVLLILLVVMMLAMPMFVKRLPVDLPKTDMNGTPTPIKSLAIAMLRDGKLQLQGSPAELPAILSQINGSSTVELNIDKEVKYEVIAQVVSAVQGKAPKEIILVTR